MKYDVEYFYNMLRLYSNTAEHISKVRWDFVREANVTTVLDYGSGCGFFKAFAPEGISVDTYDIMPVPITGITKDRYDLITFWDVLEHIPDFGELVPVFSLTDCVAVTVPIKPDGMPWNKYKHYKPLEHVHHFTKDSLCALMRNFGFELYKSGDPECPPRKYIQSFLFVRKDGRKTDSR